MKKIFVTAAAILCAGMASAQNLNGIRLGMTKSDDGYSIANTQTVVQVTVTLQKESIRKGPYSRYSQKQLGVIAPLTDRDNYTIKNVSVDAINPGQSMPAVTAPQSDGHITPISHTKSDTSFVRFPVNFTSATVKGADDMAAEAARTIFAIRKQRNTLISGDAGENVFGAGLAAALQEYANQEEEYLSLFLGKQFVQELTLTFDVVPQEGKLTYTVCRLSDSDGIVTDGGREITIVFAPGIYGKAVPAKYIATYRFPAITDCTVYDGNKTLDTARLPIYQFGPTIYIQK